MVNGIMIEKRFNVENERTVYDNLFHRGYVCSWKIDAQELVRLLNEQQSVIDKQNRKIRKLENILKKFQFPVERVD